MKWNCGPTYAEIVARVEAWHGWYAWHPVRVGSRDCRWLEQVERKGWMDRDGGWNWEYRIPSSSDAKQSGSPHIPDAIETLAGEW